MTKEQSTEEASNKALKYSAFYGGKIETVPKVPVRSLDDFSIWYTPGVAAVSRAIEKDASLSFEYTNRWNTIGILTDGSRVLGLGNIGPEASQPVMEGKALIYKFLGGVDALPIPIRITSAEEFVSVAKSLEPALGGINLEDVESPKCFGILERLRQELSIPVWHDDQQGTAGITLAALYNALDITDRKLGNAKIVFLGSGAANVASARLLMAAGANPGSIVLVDSKGVLHSDREDMDQLQLRNKWKYDLALVTNSEKVKGKLQDALRGADVLVAASKPGPNVVSRTDIAQMNPRAIVFLLANPVPEMWPSEAADAGAEIVATGRSDFPNQVNNSVFFPAVFRGTLDVRAKTISDGMVIAGAKELANFAKAEGVSKDHIVPTMLDWEVFPTVAASIGIQAQVEGLARKKISKADLFQHAKKVIEHSRKVMKMLMDGGVIESPP